MVTEPRPKHRLSVKGRGVFGMAGVWSPWMNPKTGQWEDTFSSVSTITSNANGKMGEIHDRHPVILAPREYGEWLAESERPPVHLLRILVEEEMVVDPLVVKKKDKGVESERRGLFDRM